jgi:hypothetical protein
MTRCWGFALAVLASMAGVSHADDRIASTGFYAEGGLGAVVFLPHASDYADAGPAFDLRIGRDLFSWLSLGVYMAASMHEANVPPPPTDQYFQLYRGGADVRLQGRLSRIAGFLEGGAGGSLISNNILQQVMITKPNKLYSLTLSAGAGLEYQLENRHYAFGIAVDGFLEAQFASMKGLDSRFYLRYTYGGS